MKVRFVVEMDVDVKEGCPSNMSYKDIKVRAEEYLRYDKKDPYLGFSISSVSSHVKPKRYYMLTHNTEMCEQHFPFTTDRDNPFTIEESAFEEAFCLEREESDTLTITHIDSKAIHIP